MLMLRYVVVLAEEMEHQHATGRSRGVPDAVQNPSRVSARSRGSGAPACSGGMGIGDYPRPHRPVSQQRESWAPRGHGRGCRYPRAMSLPGARATGRRASS
jgi:hypothetical protein